MDQYEEKDDVEMNGLAEVLGDAAEDAAEEGLMADEEASPEDIRNQQTARRIAQGISELNALHKRWCPTKEELGIDETDDSAVNSRDVYTQYYRELFCPGGVPTHASISNVAMFEQHYRDCKAEVLGLKTRLDDEGILDIGASAPSTDMELQRNQDCVTKIFAVMEALYYAGIVMRCEERLANIRDPATQQMFSSMSFVDPRFIPKEEQDLEPVGKMKLWAETEGRKRGYRRKDGWFYKQYVTEDGFPTHAWVRDMKIDTFVYHIIYEPDFMSTFVNMALNNGHTVIATIQHLKTAPFPIIELEETRGWWAFPNGLFYIGDLKQYNDKKREGRVGKGQPGMGTAAPKAPTRKTRWGYEPGDGPKFYKFLRGNERLPADHHPDIGDARDVSSDIVAVNYIPIPFEIDLYIQEMKEFEKKWCDEHHEEIERYRRLGQVHPRHLYDGFFLGIQTPALQSVFTHQFELREQEYSTISYNVERDLQLKKVTDSKIVTAAKEKAIKEAERDVQHVYECQFLFVGRLVFPIDKWRLQAFYLGTTGTGKSTVLRAVQNWFQDHQVVLMANRVEKGFSIQDIALNKPYVWFAMDVDNNFQLDQMQWNCLVSGEGVNAAIKNGTAITINEFDVPSAMAANCYPPFNDQGGATSERMAVNEFNRPVKQSNTELLTQICAEHPRVIYKAVKARHYFMRRFGGIAPYAEKNGWLGKYFKKTKGSATTNRNTLEAFLFRSGLVVVGEGRYCSVADFDEEYKKWHNKPNCPLPADKRLQHANSWANVFQKFDIQIVGSMYMEKIPGSFDFYSPTEQLILGCSLLDERLTRIEMERLTLKAQEETMKYTSSGAQEAIAVTESGGGRRKRPRNTSSDLTLTAASVTASVVASVAAAQEAAAVNSAAALQ
jgi:hypothetical protein